MHPSQIEEECEYGSIDEVPKDDTEDFMQCVRNLSTEDSKHPIPIATFDESEPKYSGGTPDRRGTTGLKVSRNKRRLVARDGNFYFQEVERISSDPALGPRTEVRNERELDYPAAAGKTFEAIIRSQSRTHYRR